MNVMSTIEKTPLNFLGDTIIDVEKYKNLVVNEEAKTIEQIDALIKMNSPDVVFVDFLQ
jgi:hypothetical protein